jgi:hypothetical protein
MNISATQDDDGRVIPLLSPPRDDVIASTIGAVSISRANQSGVVVVVPS